MKQILLLAFCIICLNVSAQTNCEGLKTQFKSYDEAIVHLEGYEFSFIDKANTYRSSWIRGAVYLSCDQRFGYLIIKVNNAIYIHQNVPINVWRGFKTASSMGSYYSGAIRGRYRLNLN
jgi:hypothetical protein